MAMCASGLLLSALILIIILHDIFSFKIIHMIQHSILGAIACALFFTLCNYGFEPINWVLLALIPIIIFIQWIYTAEPENKKCNNDEYLSCDTKEIISYPKTTTYTINLEKKKPPTCKDTIVKYNNSTLFTF